MADPLQLAASAFTSSNWEEEEWRQFGRDTGTSDILNAHPRLYRSLSFGDSDYPDAALDVLGDLLNEGIEPNSGEAGRMELLADAMPELPKWVTEHGAPRVKRLFLTYLAARDLSELPPQWRSDDPEGPTDRSVSTSGITLSRPKVKFKERQSAREHRSLQADEHMSLRVDSREIFIVHGHSEADMNSVRTFVQRETGLLPISLAEEVGMGRTIIEKFEEIADISAFVIVLLTPDDVGQTASEHQSGGVPSARARQNVILELGYFVGKIGRKNIVVLNGGVESPSDINGLGYIKYPGDNWKYELLNELKAARLTPSTT